MFQHFHKYLSIIYYKSLHSGKKSRICTPKQEKRLQSHFEIFNYACCKNRKETLTQFLPGSSLCGTCNIISRISKYIDI